MSVETNKEIVRRFFDAFNDKDLETFESLVDPEIVIHDPLFGENSGIEIFRVVGMTFLTAFPDQHTEITLLTCEADLVTCIHRHRGTHLGELMGFPPSGRPIDIEGIEVLRVADGRIAEFWRHDDDAGMMKQIGMIPEPAQNEA
jgi:steroid delta-isomerase-like uncharacterized protein